MHDVVPVVMVLYVPNMQGTTRFGWKYCYKLQFFNRERWRFVHNMMRYQRHWRLDMFHKCTHNAVNNILCIDSLHDIAGSIL